MNRQPILRPNFNKESLNVNEFHRTLYPHLLKSTKRNLNYRINETLLTIQSTSETMSMFRLPTNFVSVAALSAFVHASTNIDITRCKNKPNTLEEYKRLSKNGLNRQISHFLGNFVFAPIVFKYLFKFCVSRTNTENATPMLIGALIKLLKTKLVFARTKPIPLIPHSTFSHSTLKSNKFNDLCSQLFSYYDIDYKPQKCESSESVYEYVIDCLGDVIKCCHLKQPIMFRAITDDSNELCVQYRDSRIARKTSELYCAKSKYCRITEGNAQQLQRVRVLQEPYSVNLNNNGDCGLQCGKLTTFGCTETTKTTETNVPVQCVRVSTQRDRANHSNNNGCLQCKGYPIVNAMQTHNMSDFLVQLHFEENKLLNEMKELNNALLFLVKVSYML